MQNPKLQSIIEKMVSAGESEEDIANVIKNFSSSSQSEVKPPPTKGNSPLFQGLYDSRYDMTVPEAMVGGAKGWLKGAINIPGTLMGMAESLRHPIDTIKSIPEGLSSMWDTATRAGSNPEAFGEMMGQVGGQPLLTAGIAKLPIRNMVGKTLQGTGGIIKRNQPISGMIPRMVEPRVLRNIERSVGSGMERLGSRMIPSPETPVPNYNFKTSGMPDIDVSGLDISNPSTVWNKNVPGDKFVRPDSIASGVPKERIYAALPLDVNGMEYTRVPKINIPPIQASTGMPGNMQSPNTYSMPRSITNNVAKPTVPKSKLIPANDPLRIKALTMLKEAGVEATETKITALVKNLKLMDKKVPKQKPSR